jgi:GcrA cell cycle regulator
MDVCKRTIGRRSILSRYASFWCAECRFRLPRRSTTNSGPAIRAMRRSAGASAWDFRGPDPAEKRLERALKAESAAPKLSKKPKRSKTVLVPEAPGLAPPPAVEPVKLALYRHRPAGGSLIELKPGDCRYPYGGDKDSEPIVFCGHPRRDGSSYCTPHFRLTHGPGTASERAAGRILLRLVEAA